MNQLYAFLCRSYKYSIPLSCLFHKGYCTTAKQTKKDGAPQNQSRISVTKIHRHSTEHSNGNNGKFSEYTMNHEETRDSSEGSRRQKHTCRETI